MRTRIALAAVLGVIAVGTMFGPNGGIASAEEPKKVAGAAAGGSFKDDVKPILSAACVNCHNPGKKKGGVDLSTFAAVSRTLKAGDPSGSKLYKSLLGKGAKRMPPKSTLADNEIETIKAWIAAGAKDN